MARYSFRVQIDSGSLEEDGWFVTVWMKNHDAPPEQSGWRTVHTSHAPARANHRHPWAVWCDVLRGIRRYY